MSNPLTIAVIADDITGAADTGVQFCPAVGPVHLASAGGGAFSATAIQTAGLAVFTNTRNMDAKTAAKRVRKAGEAIRCLAPRMVYKKIDSCLRGNPGAEIDALLQAIGASASFVAPALPQQGRTTVDGVHRVNGVPVADTDIGRDPLCPVRESQLSVLLSDQSTMPVGHVNLACIENGSAAMIERVRLLLDQGCQHITFDAEQTTHLDAIAALNRDHFKNTLLVGSAGLAASLAKILARKVSSPPVVDRPKIGRWLFVCGSASRVLADQVMALTLATGWPCLSMEPLALASGTNWTRGTQQGADRVAAGEAGGLILSVKPILEARPAHNPDRVVRGLSTVAAAVLRAIEAGGVFLSGGDTAEAVRHRIGASALLIRQEILPGLMCGEFVGGPHHGLPVVTKAGAFGRTDTLNQLINALK